jgi:endogenous inhibitor of DNA gyrase (YacG/DUF329 family)
MDGVAQCVYCRQRPVVPAWRPFCSARCKMADLGRWLAEDYRVPGPSSDDGVPPSPPPRDGGALDES